MTALGTERPLMLDWLTDIFSRAVGPKTSLPLFLASGFILFAPDIISRYLGMAEIRKEYALYFGVLLIFSACMLTSSIILSLKDTFQPMARDWLFVAFNKKVLRNLTNAEKEALRPYIIEGEVSVSFRLGEGVVNLLERKKVLSRAANTSVYYDKFHYIMQPWAREHLAKNKDLLS
jgi:hypothetical protein